jgi:hypothetical protein
MDHPLPESLAISRASGGVEDVEHEIAPVVKGQVFIDRNIPGPHISVHIAMRFFRDRVLWIGWRWSIN